METVILEKTIVKHAAQSLVHRARPSNAAGPNLTSGHMPTDSGITI